MPAAPALTLFHHPHSRSAGVRVLLEELRAAAGVDYAVELVDLKAGAQRTPAFLALNPMGKLPTLRDGETIVTEQVAIYLHLADRHPQAGLAPAIDDPLRGSYLRWMVFYAACFEPAVIDRSLQRGPAERATSPYADFETMFDTLLAQIARGPWMLGERYSAADVLWGTALSWTSQFGLIPEHATIREYIDRNRARPAFQRAAELDEQLLGNGAG